MHLEHRRPRQVVSAPASNGSRMSEGHDDLVVPLAGVIDLGAAEVLAEMAELAKAQSKRLVIDLRDATHLDSDGLRGLLRGQRTLEGAGSSLVVSRPSGPIRAVIAMSGTSGVLEVRD
jgi:anti-anti-sigma factor